MHDSMIGSRNWGENRGWQGLRRGRPCGWGRRPPGRSCCCAGLGRTSLGRRCRRARPHETATGRGRASPWMAPSRDSGARASAASGFGCVGGGGWFVACRPRWWLVHGVQAAMTAKSQRAGYNPAISGLVHCGTLHADV